uniref:Uncharacterized protein n=1 Tax=Rhizophora mucronata TaxID=61149 RepID=A0A2P2N1Q2_RHIMU
MLMNFKSHQKSLLHILNQTYVSPNISLVDFDHIINNIMTCNYLSISNKRIPVKGHNHTKALHISIFYRKANTSCVLINNRSSLNVIPKDTLK